MNDLRLKASYLRYDLNTVISSKPKDEKKSLKELTGKLFNTIDDVTSSTVHSSQFLQEVMY
jgi:photosystem II oxygen-evolving enhancer protein 3